jgi:hypothetical protein
MKTFKAILKNPFLIGTQGFLVAAVFIWSNNEPAPYAPPAPVAATAQADLAS